MWNGLDRERGRMMTERIEFHSDIVSELEGLAWMGPVDVEFSPAEGWTVHVRETVRRWRAEATFQGSYAPIDLELVYDSAQEAMDAVMRGIESFDPASLPEAKAESHAICPECGGLMHSVMYGKRGAVTERWVLRCSECRYDTDDFQGLLDRVFPKPPPEREDSNFIVRNITGRRGFYD